MQNKRWSMIETASSTTIGYVVAILAQMVILPLFGIEPSLGENMSIAALFTVVSLVRGYFVRRLFNAIDAGQLKRRSAELYDVKRVAESVRGDGVVPENPFFDLDRRMFLDLLGANEAAVEEKEQ